MSDKADRLAELRARNEFLGRQLALYQDVIEHLYQGLCVFDANGRVVLHNSRYPQVVQLPEEAVRDGMPLRELVEHGIKAGYYKSGKTAKEIEKVLWANLKAGPEQRTTLTRGGKTYAVRPCRTAAGRFVATFEDITIQANAEEALRESEAQLNAILDAMPDCVKIFDETGELVHINPAGLELLEAPDFASLSKPGYDPVPPEYRDERADVHRRVMAGETVVWTYELVGLQGRRRHVEGHAVPFHMPDGAKALMCISRDVNERQEVLEALQHSEERLRLIQEATGLADFQSTPGTIEQLSEQFVEQAGLPAGTRSLSFAEWLAIVHPDDREQFERDIAESHKRDDDTAEYEFRIVRPDNGEVRWIYSRAKVTRDETGNPVSSIGAHLDITERKLAEEELRATAERLRLVQEATGLADFEANANGIAQLSDGFVEQAGLPAGTSDLPFDEWLNIVHPDDRERVRRDVAQSLDQDDAFESEFRIVRPDNGEVRWIFSRTKVQRDETGHAIRTIGAHLDTTERKRAEEALRESEERFRLAAEAAGLGVWDYDLELDRREWSGRLREIFGIAPEVEPSLAVAEACIHPSDREKFSRTLQEARAADVHRFEASFRILRASDGAERWIAMNGWRTHRDDTLLRRIIMTVRDVTDEKTADARVRWSASHDSLTQLANRGLFHDKLEAAIHKAELSGRAVGLMLLDMDHFKQINDSLGHDAGDMLLKMFAKRLKGVVRNCDTVARFGGDEFAVVMPELDGEHVLLQVSRAIQQRLREPFIHAQRLLDCRVSIGSSIFPEHGRNSEELIKNADIALYAAKNAGRGIAMMFEPHMREHVQRRTSMIELARSAIEDDRVVPYYQPKLNLVDRSLLGFEALLRWRMPNGRIGSPAALEAAFEDPEVAAQISDRMIERVVADMRYWLDRGVDFQNVAINASAAEFRRDSFAERVLEQLARAEIPTRCFQLEVTETVFLGRGAEYVHRALALLNMRGVKIALDDFGTGYASLRHLKQFPVDIIKIDQSFVHDMADDPGDEAIIRAIVQLGRSLGIKVVAEGIEQEEQARRLVDLECDAGQGFLFSRAVPANRVAGLVDRWPAPAGQPLRKAAGDLRLVAKRG